MMADCEICGHYDHERVCRWPVVTYERFTLPGNPTVIMSRENVDRYCVCGSVDAVNIDEVIQSGQTPSQ